jgi:hypothetical protein
MPVVSQEFCPPRTRETGLELAVSFLCQPEQWHLYRLPTYWEHRHLLIELVVIAGFFQLARCQ